MQTKALATVQLIASLAAEAWWLRSKNERKTKTFELMNGVWGSSVLHAFQAALKSESWRLERVRGAAIEWTQKKGF